MVLLGLIVVIWLLNIFDTNIGPLDDIAFVVFGVTVALVFVEVFTTGTPRLGSDGLLIAGFGMIGGSLGYALLRPSQWVVDYQDGIGVYLALAAGALALVGGTIATLRAPYGPRRPLPVKIAWGRVAGAVVALLFVVGSALGEGNVEKKTEYGWLFDARVAAIERVNEDIPPDIAAEIQRLEDEAGDDINKQIVAAQSITNLINSIQSGNKVVHNGVESDGPGLGWISMALAAAAIAAALPASGALGSDERLRWIGSVILAGIGLALMVIPMAFTLGIVRVATGANPLAGIGAFVTFIAGFVIFASGRGVVNEFRRQKVYADVVVTDAVPDTVVGSGVQEEELEGAVAD
jgi:hypothetical protein